MLDGSTLGIETTDGGPALVLAVSDPVRVESTTVDGVAAYRLTLGNGQVDVMWSDTDSGLRITTLQIPTALADRADDLIAAVRPAA